MESRIRRPYEKKTISKSDALIFGLGLGALLATVAIIAGLTIPSISRRLDNVPYYAGRYYRKLVPHPEFLPTPAPVVALGETSNSQGPFELSIPPVPVPEDIVANASFEENHATDNSLVSPQEALSTGQSVQSNPLPATSQVKLSGITHQWQTWNNCGPATITMNTNYFGRPETQVEAAQFLKPNKNDKNVSPHELAKYAQTIGMQTLLRQGGTIDLLKLLLNNDFPVLVETWLVHDGDGLGHYRLITGYDDETAEFITNDSLNGPNFRVSYRQFEADWRVFNRLYLVVFPPEQASLVYSLIGSDLDTQMMYERLADLAQREIEANPSDAIAHFNQGEALARLGRYGQAVDAFDQARTLGLHWRRLWYQFTPFEAYYAVGRYQDVLDLAEATITGSGGLEEVYYYQGLALYATGQPEFAQAFQNAIDYNPHFSPAIEALNKLQASSE